MKVGSTFLRKAEAAGLLGVTERCIYNYVKRGYLRSVKEGKYVGVMREDVLELKEAIETDLPFPINKITISKMVGRISRLESEMDIVKRMLNLRRRPLDLNIAELNSAYESANYFISTPCPKEGVGAWADFFVRMNDEDLERISKERGDPHPWRVFYKLCNILLEGARIDNDRDSEELLMSGRANLKTLVSIWTETKGESPRKIEKLYNRDVSLSKKVIKNLLVK